MLNNEFIITGIIKKIYHNVSKKGQSYITGYVASYEEAVSKDGNPYKKDYFSIKFLLFNEIAEEHEDLQENVVVTMTGSLIQNTYNEKTEIVFMPSEIENGGSHGKSKKSTNSKETENEFFDAEDDLPF